MNQFFLIAVSLAILSLLTLGILFLLAWSAKKTLLRGETAWSAKSIPINRRGFKDKSKSKKESSFSMLQSISEQTREYLNYEEEFNEKA